MLASELLKVRNELQKVIREHIPTQPPTYDEVTSETPVDRFIPEFFKKDFCDSILVPLR